MMFFWISVVPPSMELARERRNECAHTPPSTAQSEPFTSCEYGPSISTAISCSRWCVSTHAIFPVDASGPGISPRSSLVSARARVLEALRVDPELRQLLPHHRVLRDDTAALLHALRELEQPVERDPEPHLQAEAQRQAFIHQGR